MAAELQTAQAGTISNQAKFFARAVILAIALLLLSRNVTRWFTGWHEWNSALYSSFARNHIQYGLGYTKLFCTWGEMLTLPTGPQRYLNHPPLIAVWAAIPMFVFGDHEWVGRSVPIVATLGSAWVLMVIVGRLQSTVLSLLTGCFYVMLPVTAYFGRMLDHTSPVQFFSLLMLHGYLQWAGLYGNEYRRTVGAVYYILGVVLGIGTGWAALIMAGLIWLWHICRVLRYHQARRLLLWVTVIPVASLAVVVVHILWGCRWNVSLFGPLLWSRTSGSEELVPWAKWFSANWSYLMCNVSGFGAGAAVIYLAIIPAVLRHTGSDSPFRQIVRDRVSVVPSLLLAMQGLIWVFAFKRQSWVHDYWQYFGAPFFAVAMATVVLATFILLSKMLPRGARWVALLLVILPMPFFASSFDMLHHNHSVNNIVTATVFSKLEQFVPARAPVMTSEEYPRFTESFGSYTSYWITPQVAYYANRRLIYSTDINEIESNRENCAAYILQLTEDPNLRQLAQQLNAKYELAWAWQNYRIFLLNYRPQGK